MAEEGGRVWGMTIVLVRERVWILSLFGVAASFKAFVTYPREPDATATSRGCG